MVKINYKGPKTFEDFVRKHYDAALQSLPLEFRPTTEPVIQVTLDYDRRNLYARPSDDKISSVVFGVPPNPAYPNPFQILGFSGTPSVADFRNHAIKSNGNNGHEQFDEAIDRIFENYSEDQRLEASRALRKLCGPEAIQNIAERINEALSAEGFPKNYNPYMLATTPSFWESCLGIDSVVRTSTFHDPEIYVTFSPNFVAEARLPGLLVGNLPSHIRTHEEYMLHIYGFLRERGVKPSEYHKYLAITFHNLFSHGLAHNRLVADSYPYREFRDFYREAIGKKVSQSQFEKLGEHYASLTKRISDLDLDVLNEAFATIARPSAGCLTIEEKTRKVKKAASILKRKPELIGQIQDIITYAWARNRNALEVLQKES
ncbi:hypothetical protein HYX06_04065 [Candidatus Woesearchaeota archaeon]|nr:hypothetical protein [Candidatus Woesearchaeota archaeon]